MIIYAKFHELTHFAIWTIVLKLILLHECEVSSSLNLLSWVLLGDIGTLFVTIKHEDSMLWDPFTCSIGHYGINDRRIFSRKNHVPT